MRSLILIVLFYTSILTFTSCKYNNSTKEKELKLKEKEINLRERELALKEGEAKKTNLTNSINNSTNQQSIDTLTRKTNPTKYIFILVDTNEPRIEEHQEPTTSTSKYSAGIIPEEQHRPQRFSEPSFYGYTSDIISINNYSEDKKYMEMDKYERLVSSHLETVNLNLKLEVNSGMSDVIGSTTAKVLTRKAYVFDTYEAASEKRNKIRHSPN